MLMKVNLWLSTWMSFEQLMILALLHGNFTTMNVDRIAYEIYSAAIVGFDREGSFELSR
jgi:hypothetical protein